MVKYGVGQPTLPARVVDEGSFVRGVESASGEAWRICPEGALVHLLTAGPHRGPGPWGLVTTVSSVGHQACCAQAFVPVGDFGGSALCLLCSIVNTEPWR